MSLTSSISRFSGYYKRNGLAATFQRGMLSFRRALLSSRNVLFYCDLSKLQAVTDLPSSITVDRLSSQTGLSQSELSEMTNFWNPALTQSRMTERFALGASLWLIKVDGSLAGYGWTLQARTVEANYFPLGADDVQFLDFHVFPKFRGRALDWFLMTYILNKLSSEGRERAFAEAAEWNQASIASIGSTAFRRFGVARKYKLLGRTVVAWSQKPLENPKRKIQKESASRARSKRPTRPNVKVRS
jgi:ribosomal protein S18 acetylase RimI-like enzyme